jgi:hypothetical protein
MSEYLFDIGDQVTIIEENLEGKVADMQKDDDGNRMYLVSYVDENGVDFEKWFEEPLITKTP